MKYYKGDIIPEENTIFVFGSNPEGRHGAGSAKVAVQKFGAIYGQGEGLQGNAYALPTTDLKAWKRPSLAPGQIVDNIEKLYQCCKEHPDKKFKVAYRNQPDEVTLCGYSGQAMMMLFKAAAGGEYPDNLYFSEEWYNSGNLE